TFEVETNNPIEIDFEVTNVDCTGELLNVTTDITGGVEPYNFTWTGPNGFTSNTLNLSRVENGIYTLSGQDAVGCNFSEELDVSDPNILRLFISYTDVTCFEESDGTIDLTILGGEAPYSIVWTLADGSTSNNEDLNNLPVGD